MWKEVMMSFLLLSLIVSCGSNSDDNNDVTPPPPQSEEARIHVSGKITFDRVPIGPGGLNFERTQKRPVRNAGIEIFSGNGSQSLAAGETDGEGRYDLTIPPGIKSVVIAVFAQMKSPSITVVDNTAGKALYAAFSAPMNVQDDTILPDMNIPSGWEGNNSDGRYSGNRSAAPFAILDDFYKASSKIAEAYPGLNFPPLKVNWSVDNINVSGSVENGQIGTSHFNPSDNQIYILGKEDVDTDEYDAHVIVHEWGHYFEQNLGRSDSLGGPHALGEQIDMTLALSEGWGNALSAMVLDPDIVYRDSSGPGQQNIQIEFSLASSSDPKPGWFSEVSVQEILYDLYRSRGIRKIVNVMHRYLPESPAQTSIFSFLNGFKIQNPEDERIINSISSSKRISHVMDDYGTDEKNDGGFPFVLPVYRSLSVGEEGQNAVLAGAGFRLNEMVNERYFRFTAMGTSTTIIWKGDNTVGVQVYDGGKKLYDEARVSTSGEPIGPVSGVVPTQPGKEYVIRAATDGSLVPDSMQNYTINIQLQ